MYRCNKYIGYVIKQDIIGSDNQVQQILMNFCELCGLFLDWEIEKTDNICVNNYEYDYMLVLQLFLPHYSRSQKFSTDTYTICLFYYNVIN